MSQRASKYLFSGFQTKVHSRVAQKHCRLSPDIQYQEADLWNLRTEIQVQEFRYLSFLIAKSHSAYTILTVFLKGENQV